MSATPINGNNFFDDNEIKRTKSTSSLQKTSNVDPSIFKSPIEETEIIRGGGVK